MMDLTVRTLREDDLDTVVAAFGALGWEKPRSLYERYLTEQEAGHRTVFFAVLDGVFAGYVTLNLRPSYPPFCENRIPEIQDLNVLPFCRRQGVATRLLERAEREAGIERDTVGVGVGLSPDYGPAQRLYAVRGFVPDGRGLVRDGRAVPHGATVTVDHGLILYMTKSLRREPPRKDTR